MNSVDSPLATKTRLVRLAKHNGIFIALLVLLTFMLLTKPQFGTAQNLSISSSSPAFSALGFSSPVTVARGGGGTAGTGVVSANDITTFTSESISGGAVTAYNAAGTPVNLQLRWAKTDSSALGAGHQDVWNLFYQTSTTATGVQTAWVNVGTNFTFSANGSLASPTGSSTPSSYRLCKELKLGFDACNSVIENGAPLSANSSSKSSASNGLSSSSWLNSALRPLAGLLAEPEDG